MEELKNLEDIFRPDERQRIFCIVNDETGETRPIDIEDIYARVKLLYLIDNVPKKIRSHFATAKNLLVYSWCFYPFNVTAQFLAFVSVEMALKDLYKIVKPVPVKKLLKKAVEDGLIKDEGFSHIQQSNQDQSALPNSDNEETVKPYVETLIDVMPSLRNQLAHGSNMLHMNGFTSVQICADVINQLFRNK